MRKKRSATLRRLMVLAVLRFGHGLVSLPKSAKLLLKVAYDSLAISAGIIIALKLDAGAPLPEPLTLAAFVFSATLVAIFVSASRSLYAPIAFARDTDILMSSLVLAMTVNLVFVVFSILGAVPWSLASAIVLAATTVTFVGGARVWVRAILNGRRKKDRERVVIYGAGEAGRELLAALQYRRNHEPIAFVDDNESLVGTRIGGVPVFDASQIRSVVNDVAADTVLLAIPSASVSQRRAILQRLEPLEQSVRTVPDLKDIIAGKALDSQVRAVLPEDLLGRDVVPPNEALIASMVTDKVVMVTGAGGSIGSELCTQILKRKPRRLVVVDHSEFALYTLQSRLKDGFEEAGRCVTFYLASVLDQDRMSEILTSEEVNCVYHAAAYKHVPIVEANKLDAVRNNAIGTLRLAQAAIQANVERFILVSTDKAVRPSSIMGASKCLAELVCRALSQLQGVTRFACVRFGNVLDSSGSVAPLFRDQIEAGGPVTVTHPEVTRYFMTIGEASQLVLHAAAMTKKFDVFVLGMGKPVRILDLAKRMVRLAGQKPVIEADEPVESGFINIVFTGLRPGEKLHEDLYFDGNVVGTEHPRIQREARRDHSHNELSGLVARLETACRDRDLDKIESVLFHPLVAFTPYGQKAVGEKLDD